MLEMLIKEVPYFNDLEMKEKFIIVLGALSIRLISLAKAAEILEIDRDLLLKILDMLGKSFSFLEDIDIDIERDFAN
jgi:hypothetical protein